MFGRCIFQLSVKNDKTRKGILLLFQTFSVQRINNCRFYYERSLEERSVGQFWLIFDYAIKVGQKNSLQYYVTELVNKFCQNTKQVVKQKSTEIKPFYYKGEGFDYSKYFELDLFTICSSKRQRY